MRADKRLLWIALLLGCCLVPLVYYYSWWFQAGRYRSLPLLIVLALAVLYSGVQMLGNWVLYLSIRPRETHPPPPAGLRVDVLVAACGEPFEMVEETLRAACALHGPHLTWLLDDGRDPALQKLAEGLGAGYLTRAGNAGAKAGHLNAHLGRFQGEVLAIFDVDHVPEPDFLEKTAGYFADPRVGFVQVMLTFHNRRQSWIAQAADETSLEFYNPTALGTDGVGSATLMGSNALIRREALLSIGGYQLGLAEDLATSIALHAAGWRSVYVAEPLAPGIAPPDLAAWFTQQLKWARGVFELLLTAYPRSFRRLTWGQRLSYAVRMTKYWIGPAVFLHLLATILVLIFADFQTRAAFHAYLDHLAPLVAADVLIRQAALRLWGHAAASRASLARALVLVYATWPVYLLAWGMAVLRAPLSFRPTPKLAGGNLNPLWLLPQVAAIFFLAGGALYTVLVEGHSLSLLLAFSIVQAFFQLAILANWLSWRTFKKRRDRALRARPVGRANS